MEPLASFVLPGVPVVLKNSKQIAFNRRTGRPFVISNKRVETYRHKMLALLCAEWGPLTEPIRSPVRMQAIFFGSWKSTNASLPDLSNLYQMPEDLLEEAGVIENDRQIESHAGSCRVCLCDNCPDRPVLKSGPNKGKRKKDCGAVKRCPYVRTVVTLFAWEPGCRDSSRDYA